MELLKTFKKWSLVAIMFSVFFSAPGQDMKVLSSAFQESYIQEAAGEYLLSVKALKNVYDEKSYEINLRLGWLSYLAGLFTESLAYYNRAISLMPYSIEPRFGMVYPASALGNWTVVVGQYEKILEICPNNSVAHHRLGLIYYGRNEFEKAEKHFEKVVNLYPFDYDGLIMLGWSKLKMNKPREAKILFQKALLNTPGGSSALEGIGALER